ncbi:hypothetical protein BpHYR1_009698, partial [Brachionus plicatilis]
SLGSLIAKLTIEALRRTFNIKRLKLFIKLLLEIILHSYTAKDGSKLAQARTNDGNVLIYDNNKTIVKEFGINGNELTAPRYSTLREYNILQNDICFRFNEIVPKKTFINTNLTREIRYDLNFTDFLVNWTRFQNKNSKNSPYTLANLTNYLKFTKFKTLVLSEFYIFDSKFHVKSKDFDLIILSIKIGHKLQIAKYNRS